MQHLRIFCDRTGLEIFDNDGLTCVPMPFQPKTGDRSLGLQVAGGSARINVPEVHELNSIWKPPTEPPKE
jgi:sucrose-6-phosphate hydrolase SacC (GH32 family)